MEYKFLDIHGVSVLKEEFDKIINNYVTDAETLNGKSYDDIINSVSTYIDLKLQETDLVYEHIITHNTDNNSHSDIRLNIEEFKGYIYDLLEHDEETLDQLRDLVSYVDDHSSIINGITIEKVNVSDIVDDLATNAENKPLSAKQGVVLKSLVDNIEQQLNEYSKTIDILKLVYPVGAIYISVSPINPNELFGFGDWEQLKDRFLLSAGDKYEAGTIGGESEHVLTIDEMPSHTHNFNRHQLWRNENVPESGLSDGYGVSNKTLSVYLDSTDESGSGLSHNNMPPYLTVYMWQRIN